MGRILVGIGGGIAAYKVCELVSQWVQQGHQVQVVLTSQALQFVTPLTLSTLSRRPAYTDADWWQPTGRPLHIELGEWAEVMVVAPLTANLLAKVAHGLAEDLLTNTLLASPAPVLVAPAMNATMWAQPAVQHNYQTLLAWPRFHSVGVRAGLLACDAVGPGRMAEPWEIDAWVNSLLLTGGQRDLQPHRILVTAGATREYLDPVRFLSNPASGGMGFALAQAAQSRGARVTLIHAHVTQPVPQVTQVIRVGSAQEMATAVRDLFPDHDWCLMAAAVGDVQPATYHATKLPKQALPDCLPLQPTPDILQHLGQIKRPDQLLIGFAAQTGDLETPAREKLQRKHLDAIVANPVDVPGVGFDSPDNQGLWLDRLGQRRVWPRTPKLHLAHQILEAARELYASSCASSAVG
ncbi:MAG: bifunctional phosphopantothenoylcysteine decarboxylase/phosphopantothenate--cysteine ligase CoaBC [Gloeomargarita sp. SKYBB_i_bin120]|nr:bifunctional phosphopantothenoylcysteine decarboxylase/phosphopantothenate--cysteine ligase CoaBC [Gloeomargarita sp. SKYG98]MCS7293333.1 bifunctional phosphopantothenoylcysteine decarboxylase/phosphopantothenate--cysteine ligase CoaBC [Gloeomargarita sp. SKYB120]MDW8178898.1 bifunctional phosphopantothenoylcysteine decarboxylase/phosphopantothenate--cysteine ligase CoaBC [Gloeomargarita sp. SKYBB_i_bin120]